MRNEEQRKLFGQFVRSKRESLQPSFEGSRRQRTPGLRREEIAQRAGISTVWCAWIEQGRSSGISTSALDRLAEALELNEEDRQTYFRLAGKLFQGERGGRRSFAPPSRAPDQIVTDIAGIESPAFALDELWSAVCWNEGAKRLFPGWLSDDCDRNLLRYAFLNKESRSMFDPWRDWAQSIIAGLRDHLSGRRNSVQMHALISSLSAASSTFAALWDEDIEPLASQQRWSISHPSGVTESYVVTRLNGPGYDHHIAAVLIPFRTSSRQIDAGITRRGPPARSSAAGA
jgi:transcriptional regulator with XRE-family HTH domain